MLNTGVATLKPAISDEPITQPETETNTNNDIQNQETSDKINRTFIPSMNHHIEDDLLCLQKTLEADIKLNNGSINDMDIDESSWTLDHHIYQNSSNSTSTSTIPTVQDVINSDNMEEAHSDQLEEQITNQYEQQLEVPQDDDPDKATIYVPNLPKETTKESLMTLFEAFGTIKKIQLKTQRRSRNKNAVIVFSNEHNARSAMLSLNSSTYKHQKYNIRMSKKKSFMAFTDQPNVSPMAQLCHMVQDNHSEQPNTNKDSPIAEKNKSLPTDIPEMRDLTIKKSNKRKLKPNNESQDIDNDQSDLNPLMDSGPPDNVMQIQTEFDVQDDKSLPPDPITLAQYLFIYWQKYLNFHEHMEETESNTFAEETINELSLLVS